MTSRFRRLDTNKLRAAKEIFAAWEHGGIVQCSSSQWSSPLHLVKAGTTGAVLAAIVAPSKAAAVDSSSHPPTATPKRSHSSLLACASTIPATARRPSTAGATARGRETSFPRGRQRLPPGAVGLPPGPYNMCLLPCRQLCSCLHDPWPNINQL